MYPNQYISKMLETAINNENLDSKYYLELANSTLDKDNQKILMDISLDDTKHHKMLSTLYYTLNKQQPTIEELEPVLEPEFINNICNSIISKISAVDTYRVLLFAFGNQEYKNIITEIIFDEQNHTAKLNYLYSKNK